jgi:hypothetical protein
LVAIAVSARWFQDSRERRGVIPGFPNGLLGDGLQSDDLAHITLRDAGKNVEIRHAMGESGIDQPMRHVGVGEEQPGERLFRVLAAAGPIGIGVDVPRYAQQRRAVRAHRESELGVERRVEVGERLGVGFVEPVLEPRPVRSVNPAAVHVVVDQWHVLDVLGQGGQAQTLQASRNFSVSSSGLRLA